jgi:hypothetical protein
MAYDTAGNREEEDQRQQFYGRYPYDDRNEADLESEFHRLVAAMVLQQKLGYYQIEDRELIEDIVHFLISIRTMADKYDLLQDIVCKDEINPQTGEPFSLESYTSYVCSQSAFNTAKTRRIFSELGSKYIAFMARHAAMRKGRSDRLPFLERVAQKLQFTNWMQEEQDYIEQHIRNALHRSAFLINHYRVFENGEINMLMSGDTRSGKTSTSIRLLIYSWYDLNNFFRPYIEEQLAEEKYQRIDGSFYTKFEELVPPKFDLRAHMILMDRKNRLSLLATSPFPDLLYDEGNFTNLNLKSLDPESVEETIVAFGARNKHPFIIYNYQNSNRPTLFLREKFNVWFHKIHIKYGFLLIRQRLIVPGKDPWLVKKLDEILSSGSDQAIYTFFKRHPYTMREFKNMRDMPKGLIRIYNDMRQKAQAEYYKAKNAQAMLDEARENIAVELANKIKNGAIIFSQVDEILNEKGIKTQSEKLRLKNLINGFLTHENILATANARKGE